MIQSPISGSRILWEELIRFQEPGTGKSFSVGPQSERNSDRGGEDHELRETLDSRKSEIVVEQSLVTNVPITFQDDLQKRDV
jgi:hypothetical protein